MKWERYEQTIERLKDAKGDRFRPPMPYISWHGWSMEDPGNHCFHTDQYFIEFYGMIVSNIAGLSAKINTSRFSKLEIRLILNILDLESVPWRYKVKPSPEVAFCFLLHRLFAPGSRLKDEIRIFGHFRTYLSIMFNDTITHLVLRFRKLLYWDDRRLTLEKIKEYANAVEGEVGADGVRGLVD